ncbi:Lrp/AsnC family transcriptional regulator [Nisaea sediminum]|uniref:Lrp/AsnC family transcriptional regulator n=1 Tax=Nisaea sediminum TaxID=2775867 RepID=UPI0018669190|nr:Lrp/AsnC family transcriptional regulator [Nisaea sediminum]
MTDPRLDETDRAILDYIQRHGRAGYAEIGAHAGLSVSAVNERLKKLQAAGAIRGYGAMLEPAAVGLEVLAYVSVLIDWSAHNESFLEAVLAMPEVLECHHVTGDWSYLLKIRTRSNDALEDVISNRIKLLPGVTRSQTVIALKSPKESAVLPV